MRKKRIIVFLIILGMILGSVPVFADDELSLFEEQVIGDEVIPQLSEEETEEEQETGTEEYAPLDDVVDELSNGEAAGGAPEEYNTVPEISPVIELSPFAPEGVFEEIVESPVFFAYDGQNTSSEDGIEYIGLEEAVIQLREEMVNRNTSVTIYYTCIKEAAAMDAAELKRIWEGAMTHDGIPSHGDYLRYHWVSAQYGTRQGKYRTNDDGTYTLFVPVYFNFTYYDDVQQQAAVEQEIDSVLKSLSISGKSDLYKLEHIYRFVCDNVSYDSVHADDATYQIKHSDYAALIDGTAVCQGFSLLLYRMLLTAGVDARIISGEANGVKHAWNIAKLDRFYNLDSTWDSGKKEWSYFLAGNNDLTGHSSSDSYYSLLDVSDTSFRNGGGMVRFDANGGRGAPDAIYTDLGSTVELPERKPKRDGFIFLGWSRSSTGTEPEYAPGDQITAGSDTVLFAVWGDASASFVTRLYRICLDREPDSEYTGWVKNLDDGTMTGAQVAYNFIFSSEFKANNYCNEHYVDHLYQAFMGREPDAQGKAGWVEQLDHSWMTREAVFNGFVMSGEFDGICTSYGIVRGQKVDEPVTGTIQNGPCLSVKNASASGKDRYCWKWAGAEAYVENLYRVILDREPDETGYVGWVDELKHGNMTAAALAKSIIFSGEFSARNDNTGFVEHLYLALLGRTADPLKSGWIEQLDNGYMTRDELFDSFAKTDEFISLCAAYGIKA